MNEIDDKTDSLIESLDRLETQTGRLASLKYRFLLGLVMGFGTVLGATILVALTAYVLTLFAKFGIFPGFNEWVVGTIK